MENLKEFLSFIGFGSNEAEIYLALLTSGTSSVLDISKRVKIHRTNIYDALRKLLQKGLVYEINQPTKLYYAKPLKSLATYLNQKKIELDDLIKEHEKNNVQKKDDSLIKMSKGLFSLRESYFSMLESGKNIDVYGVPAEAPEIIGPLIKEFDKLRTKKGVHMRYIFSSKSEKRVQALNKMKNTEARILPSKYDSYASTHIVDNKVLIFLYKNDLSVIEITDESLAKPYQNYFEILWSKAKPV